MQSDAQTTFKITVLDEVIIARLPYGIDPAQPTPLHQRRLEVLQMKGFRENSKTTKTYVVHNSTDAEVFRRAHEKKRQESQDGKVPKQIVSFVTSYSNSRMKRPARIYKMRDVYPVKRITLAANREGHIRPWIPPN